MLSKYDVENVEIECEMLCEKNVLVTWVDLSSVRGVTAGAALRPRHYHRCGHQSAEAWWGDEIFYESYGGDGMWRHGQNQSQKTA